MPIQTRQGLDGFFAVCGLHTASSSISGAVGAGLPMHDDDTSFSQFDPQPIPLPSTVFNSCPACQSRRITARAIAKKAGATIGAIAGAAGGLAGALSGAVTGAEFGVFLGEGAPSPPLGIVAGAVVGALSGGIAGCTVGAALGEAVDASILSNRRCLDCGHLFSASRP